MTAIRWRDRLQRHRAWWIGLGVLALFAIAGRATLPLALAPWLEQRLSRSLDSRVELGDVDLGVWRGRVALCDGRLYASSGVTAPPVLAWQRIDLDLSWLRLLRREVRIQAIEIERPALRIVRSAQGGLNLSALADDRARDREPSSWTFAMERGAIERGAVRFRDLSLDEEQKLQIRIPELRVRRLSWDPGAYDRPGRFLLTATSGQSSLAAQGTLRPTASGFDLELAAELQRFPLEAVSAYARQAFGWSRLMGSVDADLHYERAAGESGRIQGRLSLGGFSAVAPGVKEPRLAWQRLDLEDAAVDLDRRSLDVQRAAIAGATLLLRPAMSVVPDPHETDAIGPSGPTDPPTPTPAATAPAEKPWSWRIGSLSVASDSAIVVQAKEAPREPPARYAIELAAHELRADVDFPVEISARDAEGVLRAEGRLRTAPLGFQGTAEWQSIDVPRVLALLAPGRARSIDSATSGGRLRVRTVAAPDEANDAAGTPQRVLEASGRLSLSDVRIRGEDDERFDAGFERLELDVDALRIPISDRARGVELRARHARLTRPNLLLTLTTEGLVLPDLARDPGEDEREATPTREAPIDVRLARIEVSDGELVFSDQRVEPAVEVALIDLAGGARELRIPDPAIESFELAATGLGDAPLRARGAFAESALRAEITASGIPLRRFNPYATAYSRYRIERGSANAHAELRSAPGSLALDLEVVLDDFALLGKEGSRLVIQRYGVPLHVALAMLRDLRGRIALHVPIQRERSVARVDLVPLVGAAVFRALMNAAISPLAVLRTTGSAGTGVLRGTLGQLDELLVPSDRGDGAPSGAASRLPPIEFLSGRPAPSPAGRQQIEQLAGILADNPELTLHLQPKSVPEDASWIAAHDDGEPPSPAVLRRLARERAGRAVALLTTYHRTRREQIAIEREALRKSSVEPPVTADGAAVVPGVVYWFVL